MKRHRRGKHTAPPIRQQNDSATAEQVAAALLRRTPEPKPTPAT